MLPSILLVSHGAAATGFSRVADGIIRQLAGKYEFHQFATNHKSEEVEADWPVYGNPDPLDAYGLERLEALANKIKPAIILVLNDPWFCCMHIMRLKQLSFKPFLIAYVPVDGIFTAPKIYAGLALYDQLVAYNNFGATELNKILALPGTGNCRPVISINHGIDTNVFKPFNNTDIHDRSAAKKIFFKDEALHDSFIVLNASKHQQRKRIDLTIKAFAIFAKDKPANVKLFLHTGATFDGPDLRVLINAEGIADRVLHSAGWLYDHPVVDEATLNLLYNATDIGINSSIGEGWGLVSFEHAATGAAQIVPGNSACKELWQCIDTVLPVRKEQEHKGLAIRFGEIGIEDIAAMLDKLYYDVEFRKQQAEKAYANAHRTEYKWEEIALQWNALFSEAIAHQASGTVSTNTALPALSK